MLESQVMSDELILASGSPRRRELLAWTGWSFAVQPVEVDETPFPGEQPEVFVRRLAHIKAQAAVNGNRQAGVILAADTSVALDGLILGKPAGDADARRMLDLLRGRSHQVYTALSVYLPAENQWLYDCCRSQVPMRSYTAKEVEAYIASGDPLDKAGAYAIQHSGFNPVEGFAGCFANVMGLPLCHLVRLLKNAGFNTGRDIPVLCRERLKYGCRISAQVFAGEDIG